MTKFYLISEMPPVNTALEFFRLFVCVWIFVTSLAVSSVLLSHGFSAE